MLDGVVRPDGTVLREVDHPTSQHVGRRVWTAATGELVRTLEHEQAVTSLTFSPASRLVSCTRHGTAHVWDAGSGALIAELRVVDLTDQGPGVDLRAEPNSSRPSAYAFLPAHGAIEFTGDDASFARRFPVCRLGARTFPFELCAGRFEIPGVSRAVLAGDGLDAVL